MDSALPLAELTQADLDEDTLQVLLRDWLESTHVLEVTVKGGATRRAQSAPQTLPELVEQLQRGELRGIQVRYRWNGAEWLDTLLGLDSVVRIVRTRLFDA